MTLCAHCALMFHTLKGEGDAQCSCQRFGCDCRKQAATPEETSHQLTELPGETFEDMFGDAA